MTDEVKKDNEELQSPKRLIKEFCSYTTTHGVGRLADAKTFFSRSIWTVFILGAFAMFIYQTCGLFSLYLRRPVSTVVKENYKTSVTFPAITICNQNNVKFRKLTKHELDAIWEETNKRLEKEKKNGGQNMTGDNDEDLVLFENLLEEVFVSYLAMFNYTTLNKLGHKYKDFVFDCNFRGNDCRNDYSKYWRQFWDYRYGNCFTFNGGIDDEFKKQTTLKTHNSGSSGGLKLNLFIESSEYVEWSPISGARIVIHNQGKMPFPEEDGINLVPGTSSSVGVRRKVFKRVDPFNNGSCRESDSNNNEDFYHRRFGSKYSRETCLLSCLAKIELKNCGCTGTQYPVDGGLFCNRFNNTAPGSELCLADLRAQLNDDQDFVKCDSNCSVPCSDVIFETTVSTAVWPSSVYQDRLVRRVKKLPLKPWDEQELNKSDSKFVRENVLQVKVFFEQLNFQEVKEQLSYKEVNLLADIGGQLGLWIGISVLTCCEVLELVLLMIQSLIKRMTTKAGAVGGRE